MMSRRLTASIAWRYLRSKKSHSAVGAISTISICGMAVATAAILCVLSVFNGFREILGDRLDVLAPDIVVTPAKGKTFADADSMVRAVSAVEGVQLASPAVKDNALVIFEGHEMPVSLKGVRLDEFRRLTSIKDILLQGSNYPENPPAAGPDGSFGAAPAVVSIGTASRLSAYRDSEMLIFAPRRVGRINPANPLSSFTIDSIRIDGVFQAYQSEYDDDLIITDIETARALFQYDGEATEIEVKARPGTDLASLTADISHRLGPSATVKDRFMQQEINFRMVKIEKWVSFLLLFFILVIASFNIISSLSMLVLEKQNALNIFRALGMSRKAVGAVFSWESVYVAAIGGLSGVLLGVILCLLQEKFGLLRLSGDPSSLIISSYPVKLMVSDIFVTLLPVVVIGALTAFVTAAFARSRCKV